MNWREAFQRQAESDYRMLLRLMNGSDIEDCHRLHYLQMASEKIAKAFMCREGSNQRPPMTHNAVVHLLCQPLVRSQVSSALKWGNARTSAEFNGYLPTAKLIESLAPIGGRDTPNAEYPWDQAGRIKVPAEYDFDELATHKPKIQKFIKFMDQLLSLLKNDI